MSKQKSKIRYDNNFLENYCQENNIELLKDYSNEKVNINIIIIAKCLFCHEKCSKKFSQFKISGCFCKFNKEKNKQEKIKATNLEKYGCECSLQNKEVKEKIKASNLEKFGYENPFQNNEVKEKIKASNLEKYGYEHPLQNAEVKEKIKATNLEKYGCEYASQNEEVKEKTIRTFLEKYGCENPLQNAEVSEKASKNAYKSYDYIFPSGRIEKIQGYENYMLNDLLEKEGILEEDIIVKRTEVPPVWYKDKTGKERRYFVDCFIKSQNRCIETKSTWTAEKKQDCIYLKQEALKDAGYECEIWVYDGKGEMVEKLF